MESLSTSIAKSLSDMVRAQFREALFESMVPIMEKAHAQIFRQINQAFQTGTKECEYTCEDFSRKIEDNTVSFVKTSIVMST